MIDKIKWGCIYQLKQNEDFMIHCFVSTHRYHEPDNTQRYGTFIPVWDGKNCYMVDTYMIDSFNLLRGSNHNISSKDLEMLRLRLQKAKEDSDFGQSAVNNCNNFYHRNLLKIESQQNLDKFEIMCDLDEYIITDDITQYYPEDIIYHVQLYQEHNYPRGLTLVKKDAKNNYEGLINNLLNKHFPTQPRISKDFSEDELNKLIKLSKGNYNKINVLKFKMIHAFIEEQEKVFEEFYQTLIQDLGD